MVPADTRLAAGTHRVAGHIRIVDTHQAAGHSQAVDHTLAAGTHRVAGHTLAAADYRDLLAEVVLGVGVHTHHTDLVDLGLDPDLDSNSCSNTSFLHDMSSMW